jgi:hypothetical protein
MPCILDSPTRIVPRIPEDHNLERLLAACLRGRHGRWQRGVRRQPKVLIGQTWSFVVTRVVVLLLHVANSTSDGEDKDSAEKVRVSSFFETPSLKGLFTSVEHINTYSETSSRRCKLLNNGHAGADWLVSLAVPSTMAHDAPSP